ncbi:hypothetical protein [Undibacterium terreum]|uniref:Uncharacterized protein n=1 Tax=Undibacterium terreum TaxID=1224302 RepID=A0A916V0F9_9BURK|nr:hypothetical protein [Undibacterium terreum]GGC97364.1 hypothetical protein GCM10011396_51120 [Undibacterium terreum]
MAKINFDEAVSWVARAVVAHPRQLTQALAEHFGVGRTAAATVIARLVEEGYLVRSGTGSGQVFAAGKRRLLVDSYSLPGIDAKVLWETEFAPFLNLSEEVAELARKGFVSVVHNANRHAKASGLYIVVEQTARSLEMHFSDNGVGVFKKIAQKLKTKDLSLAVQAVADGSASSKLVRKATSSMHALASAFSDFSVEANGLRFPAPKSKRKLAVEEDFPGLGTAVFIKLALKKKA